MYMNNCRQGRLSAKAEKQSQEFVTGKYSLKTILAKEFKFRIFAKFFEDISDVFIITKLEGYLHAF